MDTTASTDALRGGAFLVEAPQPNQIFIPEEFTEEQLMVRDMVTNFIASRIAPNFHKLEKLDLELTRKLLAEMGELGILGIPFPEQYGGSDMDFVTNMLLSELMAGARSFSLSFGAHTSIGMLPILYFGTPEQKAEYLPDLIAGTKTAAYCLTEPGSGSDALAAKTQAVLSEDGKYYLLDGQKMWITNAGIADVFIVFAKIDGQAFTGFIVEKNWEGVSLGEEEDKMGIKGSSTRQVFFEKVKVPVANVLGQKGKGHRIAFNILNIGRIKLAAAAVGGSKLITTQSVRYANERNQFQQPISNFGAIQQKLAEQAIRIYVNESATYRAAKDIGTTESNLLRAGKPHREALLGAAEEYAIECSILKVQGSECLDYVVDEGLQIYGGMGYSEEAPMAAAYRDARINRIFEGTNEINRMLSIDRLLKKALSGQLDLLGPAVAIQKELANFVPPPVDVNGDGLGREKQMLRNMKKAFLLVLGATVKELQQGLNTEQEILLMLSDMMADIYLAESAMLRTEKLMQGKGLESVRDRLDITQVFFDDAIERLALNGRRVLLAWAEGEIQKVLLQGLKRLTKYQGINTVAARRRIARSLIQAGTYCY